MKCMEKDKKRGAILFAMPLPPPVHGSSIVSKQLRESRLLSDAFDCDFVNISTSRAIKEIGNPNIRFVFRKAIRFIAAFSSLLWKLLTGHYDLCYLAITCHGKGFLKDAPFVLLCKLFGMKVIIHQHNKGMSSDVCKPIMGWLLRKVYKDVKVILLSESLYPDIKEIVRREDVFICPNGIKKTVFGGFAHKTDSNAVPRILFLSNMLMEKGVMCLLEALHELLEERCLFQCVFVGQESDEITEELFKSTVHNYGLDDIVFFIGPKYGYEKDLEFAQTDLYVLPSFNESFPLVLLEAMQHSLPIVATDVGGINDIVVDGVNGLIVPPRNSKALASAIRVLLADSEMRVRFGQAGFELFSNKFTQEHFEIKMCDILKKCI